MCYWFFGLSRSMNWQCVKAGFSATMKIVTAYAVAFVVLFPKYYTTRLVCLCVYVMCLCVCVFMCCVLISKYLLRAPFAPGVYLIWTANTKPSQTLHYISIWNGIRNLVRFPFNPLTVYFSFYFNFTLPTTDTITPLIRENLLDTWLISVFLKCLSCFHRIWLNQIINFIPWGHSFAAFH